jgi:TRAP-type C4-dicarboxylate transport system permease small subunit
MVISYPSKTTALEISISYFYLGLFIGLTGITVFHAIQIGETINSLKHVNYSVEG